MKKTFILAFLVALMIAGLLFFSSREFFSKKDDVSNENSLDGADIAPSKFSEMKALSGTVQSVSETTIILKTFPLDETNVVDVRTILSQGVPIFKMIPLSPEEMVAKMNERKDVESSVSGTGSVPGPQTLPGDGKDGFLKKAPATINDMKLGDVVTVVSDTDIRNTKEIKPKEISFVFGSQITYPEGYQP